VYVYTLQDLKIKEWKKILHAVIILKETIIAILISNKVNFRKRKIIRKKEVH
jgi:hypothetical protein